MAMEVDSSPEREDRHRRVHWSSAVHDDGPWATGDGITTDRMRARCDDSPRSPPAQSPISARDSLGSISARRVERALFRSRTQHAALDLQGKVIDKRRKLYEEKRLQLKAVAQLVVATCPQNDEFIILGKTCQRRDNVIERNMT